MAFLDGIFDNTPLGFLTGSGSPLEGLFNPTSWWDKFKNGNSNDVNKEIAEENLDYQKDRSQIEDERYLEERDYNRAFSEEEREYNRALQQQLFEREDTAQIRQAQQLSSMGINPLSQQLNGAGAGSVVSSATPPAPSVRGGQALHNDFQMQDMGVMQALSPLATLANTINQVATGQGQRDLLQTQIDKQQLDNYITAMQNGLMPEFMKGYNSYRNSDKSGNMWFNMNGTNQFNKNRLDNQTWSINDLKRQDFKREFDFRKNSNYYSSAPDIANKLNYLVSDSFFDTAEKVLTRGSQLFDKAFSNESKSTKKENGFQKFFNLFF